MKKNVFDQDEPAIPAGLETEKALETGKANRRNTYLLLGTALIVLVLAVVVWLRLQNSADSQFEFIDGQEKPVSKQKEEPEPFLVNEPQDNRASGTGVPPNRAPSSPLPVEPGKGSEEPVQEPNPAPAHPPEPAADESVAAGPEHLQRLEALSKQVEALTAAVARLEAAKQDDGRRAPVEKAANPQAANPPLITLVSRMNRTPQQGMAQPQTVSKKNKNASLVIVNANAIKGHTLQAIIPGRVWLARGHTTYTVGTGDRVPGYGRVVEVDAERGVLKLELPSKKRT